MRELPVLKTSIEIARIRRVSKILQTMFEELAGIIRPGVDVRNIVTRGLEIIERSGAVSALVGFKRFPAPICISINHVAAHGIPGQQFLQEGDLVTVDSAIVMDGWYSDGAWTYLAGEGDPTKKRLIKAAWQATRDGIGAAKALGRMGDIGYAVRRRAERYGATVLEGFTGHGIGNALHEAPNVPFIGEKGTGEPIVPGMVFTVEPILAFGDGKVKTLLDNWTIVTAGGELTAHFEHTVAVFGRYTEVLTLDGETFAAYPEYPPF